MNTKNPVFPLLSALVVGIVILALVVYLSAKWNEDIIYLIDDPNYGFIYIDPNGDFIDIEANDPNEAGK